MFRTDKELMFETTTSVSSNFGDYTALSVVSVEQYKLEFPTVVLFGVWHHVFLYVLSDYVSEYKHHNPNHHNINCT
jgi:hypothetical protein